MLKLGNNLKTVRFNRWFGRGIHAAISGTVLHQTKRDPALDKKRHRAIPKARCGSKRKDWRRWKRAMSGRPLSMFAQVQNLVNLIVQEGKFGRAE